MNRTSRISLALAVAAAALVAAPAQADKVRAKLAAPT